MNNDDAWRLSGAVKKDRKSSNGATNAVENRRVKRALKRSVEQVGERVWVVQGSTSLGDAYPDYKITVTMGVDGNEVDTPYKDLVYECSCYSHGDGAVRRRRTCSHVLGVKLHRRSNPEKEFGGKRVGSKDASGVARDLRGDTEPDDGQGQVVNNPEPPDIEAVMKGVDWEEVISQGVEKARQEIEGQGEAAGRRGDAGGVGGRERVTIQSGGSDSGSDTGIGNVGHFFDDLDPDNPPLPSDPIFGQPPLPEKFAEFRPNQWRAITEIVKHFDNGVKVVMLSAPTGSGKSLVGEVVRRILNGNSVYCCITKSLQDQMVSDFPYAKVIKGRANYATELRSDLTTEDCTGTSKNDYACDWCNDRYSCPYQVAKNEAVLAPFPILNTAYYFAETSIRTSLFSGRGLVIIDEADTLEQQVMGYVEVAISASLRQQIKVKTIPKKTIPSAWVDWLVNEVVPKIAIRRKELTYSALTLYGHNPDKMRDIKRLDRLMNKIRPLVKQAAGGAGVEGGGTPTDTELHEGWVMTGYEKLQANRSARATTAASLVQFKPIRVDQQTRNVLWKTGKHFLLMSATLISPQQMADDLGLKDDEWEVVNIDSSFPVENRPVFVKNVAAMTMKTRETAWPKMVDAIDAVLDENPGVRILVHTVSYQLAGYILANSKDKRVRMMGYANAWERAGVLRKFLEKSDAVLIAPSFDRGIDLPGEDCQVIIVAKLPYPYLGDKQVSARLHEPGGKGRNWYAVQTIRSIVQMTGRGMRSVDDNCDSYILDSSFRRLYRDHEKLFPKWWRKSLVLSDTNPKYRKLIVAARERRDQRAEDMKIEKDVEVSK